MANTEKQRLLFEFEANDKGVVHVVNNVNKAMGKSSKSIRRNSQTWTQLAYALDDAQYGFRGVQNNLQAVAVSAGVGGPLIIALTAALIATNHFIGKMADAEDAVWNFGNQIQEAKNELKGLQDQIYSDDRSLEQKIVDKWDEILKKQSEYLGFWEGLQSAANLAGFGSFASGIRDIFGVGTDDLAKDIVEGNKEKDKDVAAAKEKKRLEDLKKSNNDYYKTFVSNLEHQLALSKIYGATTQELAQQEWEAWQKIDLSRLTEQQRTHVQQAMELAYAYMGVLDEVIVTADKMSKSQDQIDQVLTNGLSNIISGFAEAAGSGKNLGDALLSGIGNTLIQLGGLLITTGIGVEAFKESLKSLQGAPAIAAGAAMVAAGAAFASAANRAGGGGGSRSGFSSSRVGNGGFGVRSSSDTFGSPVAVAKVKGQDLILALENANYSRAGYLPT